MSESVTDATPAGDPVQPLVALLDDLPPDASDVQATRRRMQTLLRAVLSIGSELDIASVLTKLTEAAAELADAQYAALGVIEPLGSVAPFLVMGVDDETQARIGRTPRGEGLLGLLVSDPRAIRLEDLSKHPASVGFPPGHPPMKTFLGVPVRIRDEVFGNLYLTEKRGGAVFDEQDEAIVTALASAAGVAIDNARMYELSKRREGWLTAAAEISTLLLSGRRPDEVLALVSQRVRTLLDGETAFIALPVGRGRLLIEAADGKSAQQLMGRPISSHLLDAMTTGPEGLEPVFLTEEAASEFVPGGGVRSALLAPISLPGAEHGVLAVFTRDGIPLAPWTLPELKAFAAQASVVLEVAERRRDAEKLSVYADRDRIARDLHDLVIQRLFATGMHLESIARIVSPADAAARMRRSVDDLDQTIREIRSTIYALHNSDQAVPSLRARVLEALDLATEHLGFCPDLRLVGLLDAGVPQAVGEHLLAVLREGLSNAARHAQATSVQVHLDVSDSVLLTIRDDGRGLPPTSRRSGLLHLQQRASELGGECSVRTHPEGGTLLSWSVPLDKEDDGDPPTSPPTPRRAPAAETLLPGRS